MAGVVKEPPSWNVVSGLSMTQHNRDYFDVFGIDDMKIRICVPNKMLPFDDYNMRSIGALYSESLHCWLGVADQTLAELVVVIVVGVSCAALPSHHQE